MASIYIYFISFAALWLGRNLGVRKRGWKKILAVIIFGFAVSIVVYSAGELIVKPSVTFVDFAITIAAGFVLMLVAFLLERAGKKEE